MGHHLAGNNSIFSRVSKIGNDVWHCFFLPEYTHCPLFGQIKLTNINCELMCIRFTKWAIFFLGVPSGYFRQIWTMVHL